MKDNITNVNKKSYPEVNLSRIDVSNMFTYGLLPNKLLVLK